MAGFFSSLAPKAQFSFADVVDEVHKLREENATLRAEKDVLRGQVVLLSHKRVAPDADDEDGEPNDVALSGSGADEPVLTPSAGLSGAPTAETSKPPNGQPSATAPAADGIAASLQSLRADLAANLGVEVAEAEQVQFRSLADQLQLARTELDTIHAEMAAVERAAEVRLASVLTELGQAEAEMDGLKVRGSARATATPSHPIAPHSIPPCCIPSHSTSAHPISSHPTSSHPIPIKS